MNKSITAFIKRPNQSAEKIIIKNYEKLNVELFDVLEAISMEAITLNADAGLMAVIIKADKDRKPPIAPNFYWQKRIIRGTVVILAVDDQGNYSSVSEHQESIIKEYMKDFSSHDELI